MFHLSKLFAVTRETRHLYFCSSFTSHWMKFCNPMQQLSCTTYQALSGTIFKSFSSMCYMRVPCISDVKIMSCQQQYPGTTFLYNKCLSILTLTSRFKQTHSKTDNLEDIKCKEYKELYLFQQIILLRVMCRLAAYSSCFFCIGIPATLAAAQLDVLAQETALNVAMVLAFYTIILTGQSFLFSSRVVGKIMMSSDQEYVKISHLSLFGKRKDIYTKTSDIDPILQSDIFVRKMLQLKFKTYPKILLFLPQNGGANTNYSVLEMLFVGDKSGKGGGVK